MNRPALIAAMLVVPPIAVAQPSFRGLGVLPGSDTTTAYAVSEDGLYVAGYGENAISHVDQAYRWSAANGFTNLGDLPGGGSASYGWCVSAHGFHVAGLSASANGPEGFRWQGGVMTGIGDLPGGTFDSVVNCISADGSVLGGTGNMDFNGNKVLAFRSVRGAPPSSLGYLGGVTVYSNATGVSADGSVFVGQSASDAGYQAMRWAEIGGMVGLGDLAGGSFNSAALAVSADGTVVVGRGNSARGDESFRWTKAGGMVGLGDFPGGGYAYKANDVSADGSVIVGYWYPNDAEAFIWDAQHGLRNLKDVLVGLGVQAVSGWTLSYSYGVSADGLTVVGYGENPFGITEAWIAHLGAECEQSTERTSISATEQQGNSGSTLGSVSNDGTVVAFWSNATNLVAGDTNARADVFIRNRPAGWTTRVSVASNGAQGNGDSVNGRLSAAGRYVVFASDAANLVANDTNARRDILIYDRTAKTTARLSVSTAGAQANGGSDQPQISADGRYIVFQSDATNLVAGDTNGKTDIFLRDRQSATTIRVSVDTGGQQANGRSYQPSLSDNGLSIVFASDATNLFMGDNNLATDIFLRNRQNNQTIILSTGSGEAQIGNGPSVGPCISANGRYITYTSSATNLVFGDTNGADDVFVRDRFNATTTRVSMAPNQGNADSAAAAISANGRYILYHSSASNLVKNDTNGVRDTFIHDTWTFLTRRVSVGDNDQQANAASAGTALSADGRFAVFNSQAGNLDPYDGNGKSDVFLRDLCH